LVDEVNILFGPAFDGDVGQQGIVSYPPGLAGKCELKFLSATPLAFGMAHLRYAVRRPSDLGVAPAHDPANAKRRR
jgi:hypothetical protein